MMNQIHEWKEELERIEKRMADINKYGLKFGDDYLELEDQHNELLELLRHEGVK